MHGETLAWSPDSSRIAFALEGRLGSSSGIAVASVEGGAWRPLVEGFGSQPDWSPSGRHVAFAHYVLESVDARRGTSGS